MNLRIVFLAFLMVISVYCSAQDVPIISSSLNSLGQVQLEIEASADNYYLLKAVHQPNLQYESITSITMGENGNMFITEPLSAFPYQNYTISAHPILDPIDTDGDGIDDIAEYNNMPGQSPLNFAEEVPRIDGTTSIDSEEVYSELAVVGENIGWAPFLNDQEFAKFAIVNQSTDNPEVYFINTNTHEIHFEFLTEIGVDQFADEVLTGEIVYNPNKILPNGLVGSYSFNYTFGEAYPFEVTRRTFELLAANMPFLQNNLDHFISESEESVYNNSYKDDYEGSRLSVVLESELFSDVDYIPFNFSEGYGLFRYMTLDENPGSRDIVLYDALPNSLPRVGGIITSVVQTPLSHVNLRAIQDNLPNAYINNPLSIDSIAGLLGKYVYYKVGPEKYEIREASLTEVNEWHDKLRPTEVQIPERDLSQTKILPLDEIDFSMSTSFGAKCSNVATMRTFGFPEGTIPNGFGIPFYFYDEFMKFNGFYDRVEAMISDPEFKLDLETRIEELKDLRKDIKDADMPQWMLDELQTMHDQFPPGTSVRCRSSTNNEDLPGFSGAGLYTSKTQHPDEGHISKSVKQVFASMWNFRAYDERDFYRVDQYVAAMGILCHPNYEDEKSNGVGVSIDPIYMTEGTFYLNTQVGEDLITNPDANSIPEEILLNRDPDLGYFTLRESNLVPSGTLVMEEEYLDQMRDYLGVIHDEFEVLYDVVGAEGFGMDIEYKVTREDQLIIKQARPWVSFWGEIKSNYDLAVIEVSDPQNSSTLGSAEVVKAKIANRGLREMEDFQVSLFVQGQLAEVLQVNGSLRPQSESEYEFTMPQDFSVIGDYDIQVAVSHLSDGYSTNDTLKTTISKLHRLEGGLTGGLKSVQCGNEIVVGALVTNYGEITFSSTELEVSVNGMIVDTFLHSNNIPYEGEVEILVPVTDNLIVGDNEITLKLLRVNGEQDAITTNNSFSFTTDLESDYGYVKLEIIPDDFPEETSWALFDLSTIEVVDFGTLAPGQEIALEDICVDYNSCYALYVYDLAGDGMCCDWGMGDFSVFDSAGETIVYNDGEFGEEAIETFCLGDGVLSTEQLVSERNIRIYPNPTSGQFDVELDNGNDALGYIQIHVFNSLGELILNENTSHTNGVIRNTISLDDQPAGTYVVKCASEKFETFFRVIKI